MHASKLGRTTSILHVSLAQGGQDDQEPRVVGYLTQANFTTESGITLATKYTLLPPPYPLSSTAALKHGTDENWICQPRPAFYAFRKALQRVETHVPRRAPAAPAIVDEWIRFSSVERFTQDSLGFVCDTFPLITTGFEPQELQSQLYFLEPDTKSNNDQTDRSFSLLASSSSSSASSISPLSSEMTVRFWLPTLVMNIEFKKLLPPEGTEWLFVRCRAKQIKNGRMDLEIVVLDEEGDIVALSSHVALIVSSDRQLGSKGKRKKGGESRL